MIEVLVGNSKHYWVKLKSPAHDISRRGQSEVRAVVPSRSRATKKGKGRNVQKREGRVPTFRITREVVLNPHLV
jgi:hypothetical protein